MRSFLVFTIVVSLSTAFSPVVSAAALGTPTDVSFTATYDGSTQYYSRLLPTVFDPQQSHDVLIALHGSLSNRSQYASATRDEMRAARDVAANNNMIMISPDYRATTSWMNAPAEADVLQIIQNLKTQYNVGKVFITGASMGGTGCLTFTALHPDLISGVSSVNGLADFFNYQTSYPPLNDQITAAFGGTETQVPAEYTKRSSINRPQSFTMPLSITAGGNDTVVPAQSVRSLFNTVKTVNPVNSKTVEFYRPNGGHETNYVDTAVALEYVIQNGRGIDTDLHPLKINASFEYQQLTAGTTTSGVVDGWTAVGTNSGVARLTTADYAAKFDDPLPDGAQMATAKNSSMYQFLGTTVRAGTYHLSSAAASAKGTPVGTFQAGFMVASNNIASTGDLAWGDGSAWTSGPGLTAGRWSSVELDWMVAPDSPAIGKYLYVDLASTGSNAVYFDNVSVTFTPVPEPATLILLGLGALGLRLLGRHLFNAF